ncbi:hypothetical protein SI65_08198 [Aspergillus cristatus]|uniref:AB hydrolase-1 domain-containing protein n=1 Tax=Aspergillus cristatus TaxID=573508 RepID=A0A1E3B5I5_ASPCR|nr:hypothetical protein SI65_08198 [Aspergillus cristatus]
MHLFTLTLPNNATVAGIYSIPPPSSTSPQNRPLIIALHGGTYDCHYFDATPTYTASASSAAFGIPFISIDRPCYGGTTSFLPVPAGSTFNQETGLWLHKYILPALWREFGLPNKCNSVVLFCHSFGSMGGIVAAALHAQDAHPSYPLAGLVISGMGDKQSANMKYAPPMPPNAGPEHVLFPLAVKDNVMFRPGTVDPEILNHSERLNAVSPVVEMYELRGWLGSWKDWAAKVKTAVMFTLVEDDVFFEATEEEVTVCTEAFTQSERVDGSLVREAPHCMELSYWAQGWYARCFGFAMECSAGVGVRS